MKKMKKMKKLIVKMYNSLANPDKKLESFKKKILEINEDIELVYYFTMERTAETGWNAYLGDQVLFKFKIENEKIVQYIRIEATKEESVGFEKIVEIENNEMEENDENNTK